MRLVLFPEMKHCLKQGKATGYLTNWVLVVVRNVVIRNITAFKNVLYAQQHTKTSIK